MASFNNYGLVSLRDMLIKYASFYCALESEITRIEAFLKEQKIKCAEAGITKINPPEKDTAFRFILRALKNDSLKVSLPMVRAQISRIEIKMKAPFDMDEMIQMVQELRNRLNDELDRKDFLHVPEHMVAYYKNSEKMFGDLVIAKFPMTSFDIDEAGKCFALSRHTSCVFHLMRVFERGIHGIAKSLAITINENESWLGHLQKINTAIEALPANDESEKKRKKEMQQAKCHLHGIRLGWRNDTMHPKDTYTEEEAKVLYNHTIAFMSHLAQNL